jgi:Mg-chelatase subunit ChlD
MRAPNAAAVKTAAERLHAAGSTPIGDAMIQAKQDLDRSGLTKLHILVITDGENNRGYALPDVAAALANQDQEHRASMYFVAFDVSDQKFSAIRDAGGLVLSASSGQELRQTLDYVLSGKILAEAPIAGPQ